MATKNDVTGDKLISKPGTKAYEDGWERIFGDKKKKEEGDKKPQLPSQEYLHKNA